MDYKPLKQPTKLQNFANATKKVARTLWEGKRYVPYAIFSLMLAAQGCSQNGSNKLSDPPPNQRMTYAQAKVEILDDYTVRVTKQNNETMKVNFFNEMYVQKVSSLKGSTWDYLDDETTGMRIYTIYPPKSQIHNKSSAATFVVTIPAPVQKNNTVKTNDIRL